jgi:hypothetical protein
MTASEIANKCIESLESDNGGEFFASSHQMSNLVAGIQLMIDAGCPFGEVCECQFHCLSITPVSVHRGKQWLNLVSHP